MSRPDAVIRIKDLHLRTFIGVKEEEITNRQDAVMNVATHCPADKACDSEDINDALNYRTTTKRIVSHLENGHFSLLEKLTQDVLNIACEHHWVTYAEVEIGKLHALRYADSVSMIMSWRRQRCQGDGMKILLTGSTGLIGRHLILRLLELGHSATVSTRHPDSARTRLNPRVMLWHDFEGYHHLNDIDAVINLAGEPIADKCRTAKQKQRLYHSH